MKQQLESKRKPGESDVGRTTCWSTVSKDTKVQIKWEWKNTIRFSDVGATCDLRTVLCSGRGRYQNSFLDPINIDF